MMLGKLARLLVLALPLAAGWTVPGATQDAPRVRGVLELFTSQGCSLSPKADRLASELSRQAGMVVLTYPVDYWDYLGWKDTLAAPANTGRQRAYAKRRGDHKIYTPQMIVNGAVSVVGSNRTAVMTAVEETRKRPAVLSATVEARDAGGFIEVTVRSDEQGDVWLVAYATQRTVAVERGENAFKKLSYSNVVRKVTRLGIKQPNSSSAFRIARADAIPVDADGYVLLFQRHAGEMLGATRMRLLASR